MKHRIALLLMIAMLLNLCSCSISANTETSTLNIEDLNGIYKTEYYSNKAEVLKLLESKNIDSRIEVDDLAEGKTNFKILKAISFDSEYIYEVGCVIYAKNYDPTKNFDEIICEWSKVYFFDSGENADYDELYCVAAINDKSQLQVMASGQVALPGKNISEYIKLSEIWELQD